MNELKVLFFFFFTVSFSFAQIRIDKSQTAEYYVKKVLLGSGIEVGEVKHIGMIGGLGKFETNQKGIGIKKGIVLSTGNVDSIIGPNNSSGSTSYGTLPESKQIQRLLRKGDKDLNRLCRGKTTDISVIEFDFVPTKNILEFKYVFASEEYTEYVGSQYNDVFGFFISGPGIKNKINLAVLPDEKTPISVNNVNHKTNKEYFRENKRNASVIKNIFSGKEKRNENRELRKNIQFDGLTTVLTVHYDVIPYKKYHIKIAIGDEMDYIYDSGVFIEGGSFSSTIDTSGKHYATLETFNSKLINIDSIFGKKTLIDSIATEPINEKFEITDIYFSPDSHALSDSAKVQLDLLADYLVDNLSFKCMLSGYTDNIGAQKYNQNLSEQRAISVISYLISKSVDRKRLNYIGNNFANPKSDNTSEEGRAKNRRVEIIIE